MIATSSPAIEQALGAAKLAVDTYTTAVNTLSPSARRWDQIAAQLTAAADGLDGVPGSIITRIRTRAADASARAQRQRSIAASEARRQLLGMPDFVQSEVRS